MHYKHGMYRSKEYKIWTGLFTRCENANRADFDSYGGRGIKVCERWNSFENFFADMGKCPDGKSIDRINNDGDYCPTNCRWATRQEQGRNKRNNKKYLYKGQWLFLSELAKLSVVKLETLKGRLYSSGWDAEKAVHHPLMDPHESGLIGGKIRGAELKKESREQSRSK